MNSKIVSLADKVGQGTQIKIQFINELAAIMPDSFEGTIYFLTSLRPNNRKYNAPPHTKITSSTVDNSFRLNIEHREFHGAGSSSFSNLAFTHEIGNDSILYEFTKWSFSSVVDDGGGESSKTNGTLTRNNFMNDLNIFLRHFGLGRVLIDNQNFNFSIRPYSPKWVEQQLSVSLSNDDPVLDASELKESFHSHDMSQLRVLLSSGQRLDHFGEVADMTIAFLAGIAHDDDAQVLVGIPNVFMEFDRKVIGGVQSNQVIELTKETNQPILEIKGLQNLPHEAINRLEANKFPSDSTKLQRKNGDTYRNWHINGVKAEYPKGKISDIQTFNKDIIVPDGFEVIGVSDETVSQFKNLVEKTGLLIITGGLDEGFSQTAEIVLHAFNANKPSIYVDISVFHGLKTILDADHPVFDTIQIFNFQDPETREVLSSKYTWSSSEGQE